MAEYAVTNPATNTVVFSVATATDAEVDDTVARADAAYRTWRRIAITERSHEPFDDDRQQGERVQQKGDGASDNAASDGESGIKQD